MTFYAQQRVVVTGGCGMVGSHLVEALLAAGAVVTVLDNYSRGQTRIADAAYVHGDAGDYETCRAAFRDTFAVFNLAATVAGVGYNQTHQAQMFQENMRLQATPMLAAASVGVPHVLQTSSVCVYSPEHNHPATEANGHLGEPHAANAGYAWAKRMGERVAQWAALEHVVIVRPSNIYGPRDYFDERAHVIPALMKKALHDDTIVVNGSGLEQREFIYVTDVAQGMLAALEHGTHQEAYNLGTSGAPGLPRSCVTIRELTHRIVTIAGEGHKQITFTATYDPGDPARWSSTTKAHACFCDWQPQIDLETGLYTTIAWYREQQLCMQPLKATIGPARTRPAFSITEDE